jgi:hypothetical protein
MLIQLKNKRLIDLPIRSIFVITVTITSLFILFSLILQTEPVNFQSLNVLNRKNNQSINYEISLANEKLSSDSWNFINHNRRLETTIKCVGSLYNQSCLYTNLYYVDSTFTVLIVNGSKLPKFSVRTNALVFWETTPQTRVFGSYADLEKFVRTVINPKMIPSVTLYFGQAWHYNVGHALFDGLYPGYVALIRFPPRHLYPFRILAGISDCNDCWSEDIYSRFGGLGILKETVLNQMSKGKWFMFDELIMGSGTLCQRCIQPNLQLPGGVELDASRLFRDRMYQQHGFIPSFVRKKSSSEGRTFRTILLAYIIDNKRFTSDDRKELNDAINEINNYTNSYLNKTMDNQTKLEWPLINVTYLHYNHIKVDNLNTTRINATLIDSRSPTYELIDNDFITQLKFIRKMDIHLSGPGTGQMYQTFLSDGSIHINLGGKSPWGWNGGEEGLANITKAYTSYMEQYMTSGTPYIKALYYPINERPKGIKKDQVIQLIRQAGQMILEGFHLPVDPQKNLASDGQLFVEMCEKDKEFCSLVTERTPGKSFHCVSLWVEDIIHEHRQWSLGGFIDGSSNVTCPFNHTLLQQLRYKYGIKHHSDT